MSEMKIDRTGPAAQGVAGLDAESALLALQAQRADLLDQKLRGEAERVRATNGTILVHMGRLSAARGEAERLAADTARLQESEIPAAQARIRDNLGRIGALEAQATRLESEHARACAERDWLAGRIPADGAEPTLEEADLARLRASGIDVDAAHSTGEDGERVLAAGSAQAWLGELQGRAASTGAAVESKAREIELAKNTLANERGTLQLLEQRVVANRAAAESAQREIGGLGAQIDTLAADQARQVARMQALMTTHRDSCEQLSQFLRRNTQAKLERMDQREIEQAMADLRKLDELREEMRTGKSR